MGGIFEERTGEETMTTIRKEWLHYDSEATHVLPEATLKVCKVSFYAGATAAIKILADAMNDSEELPNKDVYLKLVQLREEVVCTLREMR